MGAILSCLRQFSHDHSVLLYYYRMYYDSIKYILSFLDNPNQSILKALIKKFYSLLSDFKYQFLCTTLNKYNLKFNKEDRIKVSQWLVNRSIVFKSEDTLSICSQEEVRRFGENCTIDNIIVYEPKPKGEIYFDKHKLFYVLGQDNITVLSYTKSVLNEAVGDLVKHVTNIFKPIQLKNAEEKWYKPKVFNVSEELRDKKMRRYWEETSVISEKVSLFFNEETKEKVLKPFEEFYASRELYGEIGLAYKITSVFCGKAGTGKTATVKYLAQKFSRDIYLFSTLEYSKEDFLGLMKSIPYNSIVLIDDFDKMHTGYSLTVTMLGLLDGAITLDGLCLIFALNDFKTLEDRFKTITRPGRINLNLDFDSFNTDEIVEIAIRELFLDVDDENIADYLATYEMTPKVSEVKNDCLTSGRDIKKATRMRKRAEGGD